VKVIIAGYGYLGSQISSNFEKDDWDITVLRRSAGPISNGMKFVQGDLTVQQPQLTGYDFDVAVFCLAPGARSGDLYEQTYVTAQKNFLKSLRIEKYIYISSTAVYPDIPGTYTEEAGLPHTERARILLKAETVALSHPGATVLRLAGLYGADRAIYGQNSLDYKEDKLIHFIHRDDAARAVMHSIAKNLSGVYNVHDGKPQWRSAILARLGVPVPARQNSRRVIAHEKIFSTGFNAIYSDYFEGVGH
jgi:nucleoside-diphosphate-sugar epimerase